MGVAMFYELKHHLKLKRLQAKRRAIQAQARAGVWDALPHGAIGAGPINRAINEGQSKLRHIDDEITQLLSDHLLEQAQKYLVFWPEDSDDDNRIQNALGERKLSPEEITELRAQIRKERKERWEHWQMRLTLLIGLMGTSIGLVSLLVKKGP
jgi:hypothetical protein